MEKFLPVIDGVIHDKLSSAYPGCSRRRRWGRYLANGAGRPRRGAVHWQVVFGSGTQTNNALVLRDGLFNHDWDLQLDVGRQMAAKCK